MLKLYENADIYLLYCPNYVTIFCIIFLNKNKQIGDTMNTNIDAQIQNNNTFTDHAPLSGEPIVYYKASVVKRALALVIDAIVAYLPALVMFLFFTQTFVNYSPALYPAPIFGVVSLSTLPSQVNTSLNAMTNDNGDTYTDYNVAPTATAARMASVFVIAFYLFYSTVCTVMNDGATVGKRIMHIKVIYTDAQNRTKFMLLREIVCKILLNSLVVPVIISVFTILFTKKHLAVHDMIGQTMVVED